MQIRFWLAALGLMLAATVNGAGDPEAGKAISLACSACHGMDGATGLAPDYPNLAGQNEKYLLRQMELIQSNERPILLMTGQLTGKTPRDLANLAAYYASLPSKQGQQAGTDEQLAQAEAIFRGGALDRMVPACMACHSPSGLGNAPAGFPQLSSQPAEYTALQLQAYREGERITDEDYGGMMRAAVRALTDGEIAALAGYLQGLAPPARHAWAAQ